jgi:hypothetical protein
MHEMIKFLAPILLLLLAIPVLCQEQRTRLGRIELFGTRGIDIQRVRAAMPIHEGDQFSFEAVPDLIPQIKDALKQATAIEPTDVSPVCCDERGNLTVYVGLPGKNSENLSYNRPPGNSITLSEDVVNLYREAMEVNLEATQKQPVEDDSKGYALSLYPPLRAKQLAIREYAVRHAEPIRCVLERSADAEQRTVAAYILGYTNQNQKQIMALVRASRDQNEAVRNNAVRALAVLAQSSPKVATSIPASQFVSMLNSGIWTDRNKGGSLLSILSRRRSPHLLRLLRRQALDSLVEMAQWQDPAHADSARLILGRVAGIEEDRLQQLVAAHAENRIIDALQKKAH